MINGYKLSNKAVEDLENIWLYTLQNWSVAQADRYYSLIIDEIKYLVTDPYSGKDMDFVKTGYMSVKVKSHLIFYKVADNNIIEVIRILHERMDIENRLK